MIPLREDQLQAIIVEAIVQINASGVELSDTYGIHVGMPAGIEVVADVFLDGTAELITTGVSTSVKDESEDRTVKTEEGTSEDTGQNVTAGTSESLRSGGNTTIETTKYEEV